MLEKLSTRHPVDNNAGKNPGLLLWMLEKLSPRAWDSHSPMNGYPSFYPRIALVVPSPGLLLLMLANLSTRPLVTNTENISYTEMKVLSPSSAVFIVSIAPWDFPPDVPSILALGKRVDQVLKYSWWLGGMSAGHQHWAVRNIALITFQP